MYLKKPNIHTMKISIFSAITIFFLCIHLNAQNKINVRSYGATGDGASDDTKAIQAAINSASSSVETIIYFPEGTYKIASFTTTSNYFENYCLLLHSNLDIKGDGKKSIIKLGDHIFDKEDSNANAHIFLGRETANISFSNLVIDMNGSNNLVPSQKVKKNHSAIFTMNGNNYHIHDLTIKDCSGTNMINIMGKGRGLIIERCNFLNGGNYVGHSVANSNQYDYSFVYTEWDSTIVKNNIIEQQNIEIGLGNNSGGLEIHGNHSLVTLNTFNGCWPAIFISSSGKNGLNDVSVKNNKMTNCVIGINFWLEQPMKNISITDNLIGLTGSRSLKTNICVGIFVPNGNAKEYSKRLANGSSLSNLIVRNNNITADSMKTLSAAMVLHSLQNSTISYNTISGMNYSGIVLTGSKWGMNSLSVKNNTFNDFRPCPDKKTAAGYIVITDTYSNQNVNALGLKNIKFDSNKFIHTQSNGVSNTKISGAFIQLPSKALREIIFTNNKYSNPSEKAQTVKTE